MWFCSPIVQLFRRHDEPNRKTQWSFWKLTKKLNGIISQCSNYLNTGLVLYLNRKFVFGCQIVRYWNDGLKTGLKKSLFMVKNVQFLNGQSSQITLPFEYQIPIVSSIQMSPVFGCLASYGYCTKRAKISILLVSSINTLFTYLQVSLVKYLQVMIL